MEVKEINSTVMTLSEGYDGYVVTAKVTKGDEYAQGMINEGRVRFGGKLVAFFSASDNSLSVQYYVADDHQVIQNVIDTYCMSAREYVKSAKVSINEITE